MIRRSVIPENKEQWKSMRREDLTSTAISALFGVNPYISRDKLLSQWVLGDFDDAYENEAMQWGSRLEPIIAAVAEQRIGEGELRCAREYMRIPEYCLGSSFDYWLGDDCIVEIKNVSYNTYKKSWTRDGAAAHIELQLQHQLLVSGRQRGYIAALVGGNRLVIFQRDSDSDIHRRILARSDDFLCEVERGKDNG